MAGASEPSTAQSLACWCGSVESRPFSADYVQCLACGTLVSARSHGSEFFQVNEDDSGFYGKGYWFDYLPGELGQPNVLARARADLPERAVYWLATVVRVQRPPGRILELGSGPGALVGLLSQAGFQAEGLDLSPAVVELARRHFGVTMHCGPLEEQSIPAGEYAGVALFDVLEHLPRPIETLRRAVELLQPGGWILIQTPGLRNPDDSYERMAERSDHFLDHLKAEEHLFLFTEKALAMLLERLGLPHVRFMEPLYDYDMYVIASREPLEEIDPDAAAAALLGSPSQRMALALLDLTESKKTAEEHWQEAERDRQERMAVIQDQAARVGDLEGQIAYIRNRLAETQELWLASEADREERLKVIVDQAGKVGDLEGRLAFVQRQAFRSDSSLRRTIGELVRALQDNERLQIEVCRLKLQAIELEGRLGATDAPNAPIFHP